jgi:hypothetical protein
VKIEFGGIEAVLCMYANEMRCGWVGLDEVESTCKKQEPKQVMDHIFSSLKPRTSTLPLPFSNHSLFSFSLSTSLPTLDPPTVKITRLVLGTPKSLRCRRVILFALDDVRTAVVEGGGDGAADDDADDGDGDGVRAGDISDSHRSPKVDAVASDEPLRFAFTLLPSSSGARPSSASRRDLFGLRPFALAFNMFIAGLPSGGVMGASEDVVVEEADAEAEVVVGDDERERGRGISVAVGVGAVIVVLIPGPLEPRDLTFNLIFAFEGDGGGLKAVTVVGESGNGVSTTLGNPV